MSMDKLRTYYFGLYGENGITQFFFDQLMEIMEKARAGRSTALRKQDKKGNDWYLSEKMVGMMLYLDKFSDNLSSFEKRIDYLADLGVTYVHIMPLLQSREGQNDGGYAVSA